MTNATRGVVLGGTGLLGSAVARRLTAQGWDVTITGRDPAHVPGDLAEGPARFVAVRSADTASIARLVGDDCALLVDCTCFTARDAVSLVSVAARAGSTVMLSSKAVYVDDEGRHVNSLAPPRFEGPISEHTATMAPGDGDYTTREGYGSNKVAAEHVALESGLPITVLRVAKAHGRGAVRPREWVFVRRALEGRVPLLLARRGTGGDHPSAAVNVAALVETVASQPGARVLNAADPDAPSPLELARAVAAAAGHRFDEVLLDDGVGEGLGDHPWNVPMPIVLDMRGATALGYRPVGTYAATVRDEVDWLVEMAARRGLDGVIAPDERPYFERFFDYAREDAYLAAGAGRR